MARLVTVSSERLPTVPFAEISLSEAPTSDIFSLPKPWLNLKKTQRRRSVLLRLIIAHIAASVTAKKLRY